MKCQRCGKVTRKRGRFCGECAPESLTDVVAEVLVDLIAHNPHVLVGGVSWAQQAVDRIRQAQGHTRPPEPPHA